MKGHIRQRSPGRWAIVLDSPRRRNWSAQAEMALFCGNQREAQIECSRLISEIASGGYADPVRETLAAFLTRWLEHMRGQVSPRSHERYGELSARTSRRCLVAALLTNLQPAHISAGLRQGARQRPQGRAGRTVAANRASHAPRAAASATAGGRLAVAGPQPGRLVKPPRVERKQMRTLDTDGTVELIEAARETRLFVPILLGVLCGLRRGEVAALRWRSIDLDAGRSRWSPAPSRPIRASARRRPRAGRAGPSSFRPWSLEELRQHRIRQAEELLQAGRALERRSPRRCPRGWRTLTAALAHPCLRQVRSAARLAADSAA